MKILLKIGCMQIIQRRTFGYIPAGCCQQLGIGVGVLSSVEGIHLTDPVYVGDVVAYDQVNETTQTCPIISCSMETTTVLIKNVIRIT